MFQPCTLDTPVQVLYVPPCWNVPGVEKVVWCEQKVSDWSNNDSIVRIISFLSWIPVRLQFSHHQHQSLIGNDVLSVCHLSLSQFCPGFLKEKLHGSRMRKLFQLTWTLQVRNYGVPRLLQGTEGLLRRTYRYGTETQHSSCCWWAPDVSFYENQASQRPAIIRQ